ncbi:acetyltransferase [Vibrio fluvialis]|nr:acetyltransferase [Vibrio fluvialis]
MKIFKGYGLISILYLIVSLTFTKLFFRKARIIRLPIRLRNLGIFDYGKGFTTGVDNRIDIYENALLTVGVNVQINDFNHIACAENISIGNNVLIASKVYITDHDHDFSYSLTNPVEWPLRTQPVIIGDDCWIGENVSILKGVSLGPSCIVGANSVVTKSFPYGSIIAGVPAKIISNRI